MAESYDALVIGSGATGARVAAEAARLGRRVLVIEPGSGPGSTGPSAGVVRPGGADAGAVPATEPGPDSRRLIEHRVLVLDDAASVSFDFRDVSTGVGSAPATTLYGPAAAGRWIDSAVTNGCRLITDATDVRLLTGPGARVSGVSVDGTSFEAPVTVVTEPLAADLLSRRESSAWRIEETYSLSERSIENRLQVRRGEAASLECLLGFLPAGWTGMGWLVPHREHLTLGITLHRPPGSETATGLESAFERFRRHPAIAGYTTGGERTDRRSYPVPRAPRRRELASPGLWRAGSAAGLGDPIGVFGPGVGAALSSAAAAAASLPARSGGDAARASSAYLARMTGIGLVSEIARARDRPIPLGWDGARRTRYARVLASTFHALLTETGAPKESITRTLRRVRREHGPSFASLASDALRIGRDL